MHDTADILATVLQVVLLTFGPLVAMGLARWSRVARAIGPVMLCYGIGFAVANIPSVAVQRELSLSVGQGAVALAIPLLLFSLDVIAWLRLARSTVLSFVVCAVAVVIASITAAVVLGDRLPETAKVAGMMVGVYTGGTPNMAAIGTALAVAPQTFVLLNAADVVVCLFYLLFLFTIAARVLAWILPPFSRSGSTVSPDHPPPAAPRSSARAWTATAGLGVAVVVSALALSRLTPENMRETVAILLITTFGVILSFFDRVRKLYPAAHLGQYFLLVFCLAIGSTAQISGLLDAGGALVIFAAIVVYGSIALHLGAATLLRLDRDTVIVTSTAAIFGPAFVPSVAEAIRNREVVLSGLATGLLGYAVGNYLGLGVAWVLS